MFDNYPTHLIAFLMVGMLQGSLLAQNSTVQANEKTTHTVRGPRPMEYALNILGDEYALIANYEEPPVVFAEDIIDQSVKKDRSALGTQTRTFNFAVEHTHRQLSQGRATLQSLAEQYNQAGLGDEFTVKPAGPLLTLVGNRAKDRYGVLSPVRSPLDGIVRIPEQRVDGAEFARIFCEAVSKVSAIPLLPGVLPQPIAQSYATISGDGLEARQVLVRALSSLEWKDTRLKVPHGGTRWLVYYSVS
ncbi:MAG: hypothetical protein IT168_27815 [Bryobacterales bacterium]|nr:hypothetical protein [Bryobacterales bacterium]